MLGKFDGAGFVMACFMSVVMTGVGMAVGVAGGVAMIMSAAAQERKTLTTLTTKPRTAMGIASLKSIGTGQTKRMAAS